MKKLWNIYRLSLVGGQEFGDYLCSVEAETASDATGIASAGTMTSRLNLKAISDEIDGRKDSWPAWAPRLISLDERRQGRPSAGRKERLQATITPEQWAWLEAQKAAHGDKSVSDVVFRLISEAMSK